MIRVQKSSKSVREPVSVLRFCEEGVNVHRLPIGMHRHFHYHNRRDIMTRESEQTAVTILIGL